MGYRVVQELFHPFHGCFGWFILLRCNCAECRQHGAIDSTSIEKEGTCHLHDIYLPLCAKGGRCQQLSHIRRWCHRLVGHVGEVGPAV